MVSIEIKASGKLHCISGYVQTFPPQNSQFFYLFKPFFESILTFLDTKPEVVGSIEITGKRKLSCFSGHS